MSGEYNSMIPQLPQMTFGDTQVPMSNFQTQYGSPENSAWDNLLNNQQGQGFGWSSPQGLGSIMGGVGSLGNMFAGLYGMKLAKDKMKSAEKWREVDASRQLQAANQAIGLKNYKLRAAGSNYQIPETK